jgi:hypothetical protein
MTRLWAQSISDDVRHALRDLLDGAAQGRVRAADSGRLNPPRPGERVPAVVGASTLRSRPRPHSTPFKTKPNKIEKD